MLLFNKGKFAKFANKNFKLRFDQKEIENFCQGFKDDFSNSIKLRACPFFKGFMPKNIYIDIKGAGADLVIIEVYKSSSSLDDSSEKIRLPLYRKPL